MNWNLFAVGTLLSASLVLGSGCADSLVGAECAEGFSACEQRCLNLMTDNNHCGACDNQCEFNETCSMGTCQPNALPDAGGDAELDAPVEDAEVDAPSEDAGVDASADAEVDAGPACQCGVGELCCAGECINVVTTPRFCGGCGGLCSTLCVEGECRAACDAPLMECGGTCVDLQQDEAHCGSCDSPCDGACIDGDCVEQVGTTVLMGHSLKEERAAQQTLFGNLAALARQENPVIALYEGDTPRASLNNVVSALDTRFGEDGWTRIDVEENAGFALHQADVFVVLPIRSTEDPTMLGVRWTRMLGEFLDRGGVLIVLDGEAAEMWQLVAEAGLLDVTVRENHTGDPIEAVDLVRDADVLTGVAASYDAAAETVSYFGAGGDPIMRLQGAAHPVVIRQRRE